MLIGEREKQLVLIKDGVVETVVKDAYNKLKYCSFDGNRIFYTFSKDSCVMETYDSRIFNCTYKGKTIQIRDGNAVASCIMSHRQTGDDGMFIDMYKREYFTAHKLEIIDRLIKQFNGRVVYRNKYYIVDDLFAVDDKGTAYYLDGYNKRHLCLVAQGRLRTMNINTDIGTIELDYVMLTIIGKIVFLMNPNLSDSVFVNQLPPKIIKILKANEMIKC